MNYILGKFPKIMIVPTKILLMLFPYVTNAFFDILKGLKTEKVAEPRATKSKRGTEYIEEELLQYSKQGENQSIYP